ncbi:MAG TPA: flagellar hook-associated protein FlgL [Solirubrobacterales bacterium]|nr:flagellar hook-associated protein FlgL [Solirubrobacterales bacterium]
MGTRITESMAQRSILRDLVAADRNLALTQRRLSSGKQLTRPSDDPFGVNRAIALRGELEGTRQFRANVNEATGWTNATEAALTRITDVIQRARELLVSGGNDSNGQVAREAIATEIDALAESLKQEANATYEGRYVFAGTATETPPYALGASDAYAGDAGTVARTIGVGVSLTVNVSAAGLLGEGQAAADDRLLDTMRDIAEHLRGGTAADAEALRGTDLERLDANLDELTRVRAIVGATANRLQAAGARLDELEESGLDLLSKTEDADMAETLVNYSTQRAAYEAALKAGANIVQVSLLDFLR